MSVDFGADGETHTKVGMYRICTQNPPEVFHLERICLVSGVFGMFVQVYVGISNPEETKLSVYSFTRTTLFSLENLRVLN